jgi:hypothetical protein
MKVLTVVQGRNYYPHDSGYAVFTAHESLERSLCKLFSLLGAEAN